MISKDQIQLIGASAVVVVGVVVAGTVGTILTFKEADEKYRLIADEEIKSVKDHYKVIRKEGPLSTPQTAEVEVSVNIEEIDLTKEDEEEAERQRNLAEIEEYERQTAPYASPAVEKNIFDDSPSTLRRNPDVPYLVTFEEFDTEEEDFDKITLQWFREDEVLCDENEAPVDDVDGTVGEANLQEFKSGVDSIYVRNIKRAADFEIVIQNGSYAEIVAGISPG